MGKLLPILAVLVLASLPAWPQEISGPARVIDGDTLEVAGQRISLHGIDAPETKQTCMIKRLRWPCGKEAALFLRGLIADSPVRCVQKDRDRYGTIVAVCWNPGRELNETMVLAGMALAYRQFGFDYVEAEDKARMGRIGMWEGAFMEPWAWRKGFRLEDHPAQTPGTPPAQAQPAPQTR